MRNSSHISKALVAIGLVLILTGPALAQDGILSVSLDSTVGSFSGNHYVAAEEPITFLLRVTNFSSEWMQGITCGFRIYSPDGAEWGDVSIANDLGSLASEDFDLVWMTRVFSSHGAMSDTVGFFASVMEADGMPACYNEVTLSITVGPIGYQHEGKTLCLDSCFLPPANAWAWTNDGSDFYVPAWTGPHCFEIVDPCCAPPAPEITAGFGRPKSSYPDRFVATEGDEDGDGVSDFCDNCLGLPNPMQEDFDQDGLGYACDDCLDSDGDGFGDPGYASNECPDDNCPHEPNPDQTDSDGDLVGNACDNCINKSNHNQADKDADGVGDRCDNCRDVPNPHQVDSDNDDVGDECDNCKDTPNTDQTDSDGDGVGDACDPTAVAELDIPDLPEHFAVSQNYPNPFNPETRIQLDLPEACYVEIAVLNLLGQRVAVLADQPMAAGRYAVTWDGCNGAGTPVASGVYLYRVQAGHNHVTRKMMLLR